MTTLLATPSGIAADTFTTLARTPKVFRGPGILVGSVGEAYYGTVLCEWVLNGKRGPAPPWDSCFADEGAKAYETELLIVRRSGIFMMDGRGIEMPCLRPFAVLGSGGAVALGAFLAMRRVSQGRPEQMDALRAVEIAAEEDEATKLPVEWHPLKGRARVTKG